MSTATELRDRFKAPRKIIVTVPDTDLTIECRRPDLVHMVMSGLMTWPALDKVRAFVAEHAPTAQDGATVIDNRPIPTLVDRAQAVGAMLDEWVCLAAVSPKVVMSEYEALADTNVLWVEDLPFEGRQAVFNATFTVTKTAGADFRDDQPSGAPPGQSGEAVRDETVGAVGDDGSDGGPRP